MHSFRRETVGAAPSLRARLRNIDLFSFQFPSIPHRTAIERTHDKCDNFFNRSRAKSAGRMPYTVSPTNFDDSGY